LQAQVGPLIFGIPSLALIHYGLAGALLLMLFFKRG
jgi:hypothetical protein